MLAEDVLLANRSAASLLLETVAVLLMVPGLVAMAVITTDLVAPGANVPMGPDNTSLFSAPVMEKSAAVCEKTDQSNPAGRGSLTTTPEAVPRPVFVTVIV